MTAVRVRHLVVGLIIASLLAGCSAGPDDVDPASAPPTAASTVVGASVSSTSTTSTSTVASCPSPTIERHVGRVADPDLDEISGAVISPTRSDRVWVHEDSGNPPVLTLLDLAGTTVGSWRIDGVDAVDWEDVAAVATPPTLFVGDIGDNRAERDEVTVIRVPEPATEPAGGSVAPAAVLRLVLPRPADAEALLVDPRSGDVVVVTKQLSGRADVLVAPGAAWADGGAPLSLERAGTLDLGPLSAVLAGDVTPAGDEIVLRTPAQVMWWPRDHGESIADAILGREPCELPAVLDLFGEAVALLPHGGYLLVGEGHRPSIHRIG